MELAVRARPDLIITSAVMIGDSGIGLCRTFAAVTEELPVAVLTSFDNAPPAPDNPCCAGAAAVS